MAGPEGLHPLQQKFLEHAALQCGICTPGFIVAAKALLDRHPQPTEQQVRQIEPSDQFAALAARRPQRAQSRMCQRSYCSAVL